MHERVKEISESNHTGNYLTIIWSNFRVQLDANDT